MGALPHGTSMTGGGGRGGTTPHTKLNTAGLFIISALLLIFSVSASGETPHAHPVVECATSKQLSLRKHGFAGSAVETSRTRERAHAANWTHGAINKASPIRCLHEKQTIVEGLFIRCEYSSNVYSLDYMLCCLLKMFICSIGMYLTILPGIL